MESNWEILDLDIDSKAAFVNDCTLVFIDSSFYLKIIYKYVSDVFECDLKLWMQSTIYNIKKLEIIILKRSIVLAYCSNLVKIELDDYCSLSSQRLSGELSCFDVHPLMKCFTAVIHENELVLIFERDLEINYICQIKPAKHICFSPDGMILALHCSNELLLLNLDAKTVVHNFKVTSDPIKAMLFHPFDLILTAITIYGDICNFFFDGAIETIYKHEQLNDELLSNVILDKEKLEIYLVFDSLRIFAVDFDSDSESGVVTRKMSLQVVNVLSIKYLSKEGHFLCASTNRVEIQSWISDESEVEELIDVDSISATGVSELTSERTERRYSSDFEACDSEKENQSYILNVGDSKKCLINFFEKFIQTHSAQVTLMEKTYMTYLTSSLNSGESESLPIKSVFKAIYTPSFNERFMNHMHFTVLRSINFNHCGLDLECCSIILPKLSSFLASQKLTTEADLATLISVVTYLSKSFAKIILSSLKHSVQSRTIDLAREERIERCQISRNYFNAMQESLVELLSALKADTFELELSRGCKRDLVHLTKLLQTYKPKQLTEQNGN